MFQLKSDGCMYNTRWHCTDLHSIQFPFIVTACLSHQEHFPICCTAQDRRDIIGNYHKCSNNNKTGVTVLLPLVNFICTLAVSVTHRTSNHKIRGNAQSYYDNSTVHCSKRSMNPRCHILLYRSGLSYNSKTNMRCTHLKVNLISQDEGGITTYEKKVNQHYSTYLPCQALSEVQSSLHPLSQCTL